MSRMSLDTAIRLSAEVKGGGAIDRVKRSLQDLGKSGQTSRMDMVRLEVATKNYARANGNTIAGIRSSIAAFRGLQEQAKIGSREFQRYGAEIQRLEGKLRGLDSTAERASASLGSKLAAGLAAAGIGRGLQQITAQAGRFDAELRKAAAIEGGAGSFGVLRKEIEAVASAAAGTPTEVAALATALSRAGFSADQTAKSLRGIVLGAEATDTAFADMGGIVGTVLKTFQIDASQTSDIVDVLVKSANSANQTVMDVGEAMSYAAGQSATLGVSIQDTSALIALLADAGVRGSRGGNTIAQGLSRLQIAAGGADSEMQELVKGSAKMADAMARLNTSILDAEGNLKPMDQVLIAIKRQMDQLSATDQAIITRALFGADAGKGFQALLARREKDIVSMFSKMRQAGGTAEETQKKMQGFDFSIKVLGGNVENLTNQIGGMLGAVLKPLIDYLNAGLGEIQKWPDPVKNLGAELAAAGFATLGLVAAIAALETALSIVGGIKAATAALNAYTGAATAAGGASAIAGGKAAALLGTLKSLGKIGIIAIGVKFAIEGLDELLTGLVGVRAAQAAARSMAERRGLTYVPSAAVQRRAPRQVRYGTAPPPAADAAGGTSSGTTPGATDAAATRDKKKTEKSVQELLRLTDAEVAAAVNTVIGEYGGLDPRGRTDVFANILARSRSSQYPSNLVDVVTQPGQYAPNFGRSRSQVTSPNLYGRARFERVKAELMNPQMLSQSIQDVDSRLYFKGISQQSNMVRGVDFLRAPDQNFFHGPGRRDPGRNPQITAQLLSELGDAGSLTGYLDQQTQDAEQLKEQRQEGLKQLEAFSQARDEQIVKLNQEQELLGATTDYDRRRLEYAFEQMTINDRAAKQREEFARLQERLNELGVEYNAQQQLDRIESEKQQALLNSRIQFEQDLNDLMAERTRMMQGITKQAVAPPAFNPLEQQKADLDALLQKYPAVGAAADQAADLATRGFADMATGARSAKEVFTDFLKGIADALIQTAKTMIAEYIAIGIAKMFALSTDLSFTPKFTGFANGGVMSPRGPMPLRTYSRGGVANSPQVAVFGEGMMNEAFVPLPDGRRIPVAMEIKDGSGRDRMRELMGPSPTGGGAPVLNMSFETGYDPINKVEYVTVEQLQASARETRKLAANDGAKRGMSMTLDRLQQSPSTRSRVGIAR